MDSTTTSQLLAIPPLLFLVVTYLIYFRRRLPPGPRPWPVVGNLFSIKPVRFLCFAEWAEKYGPIISVWIGPTLNVVVSNSDLAREVLKEKDQVLANRHRTRSAARFSRDGQDLIWADYGPHYVKVRKVCTLELFSPKRLEGLRPIREDEVTAMVEALYKDSGKKELVLKTYLSAVAFNNITRIAFGKRFMDGEGVIDGQGMELKAITTNGFKLGASLAMAENIPWLRCFFPLEEKAFAQHGANRDRFTKLIMDEHTTAREKSGAKQHFVDALLTLKEKYDLSDDTIIGLLWDMITAGMDTTAISVEWAMAEVIKNPTVQMKAQEELDRVVGLERIMTEEDFPNYVVYLGEHDHPDGSNERSDLLIQDEKVTDSHHQFLGSILGSKEKAGAAIFYSYTRHINGFAANLEEEEAIEIATYPEVISVFPNEGRKLHTTRSWSFLGLERDGRVPLDSLWTKARYGEDVIIANLDTGVWPESESFNDVGMGPIPSKWRGTCQSVVGDDFHCNRKLIGARYFNKGFVSSVNTTLNSTYYTPRDTEGHGTHTLSTAGGGFVAGANVFGFGNGTAKGGSPKARVAAYRVCFPPVNKSQCFDADILSAFDAAISDGVDVLSVSLGGSPAKYFMDSIAIGSFHAVKKGITVVCSAGNSGPKPSTVSNLAPWIITVAASTMDREFPAYASLGNGKKLKGQSLSPRRIHPVNKLYPLISSAAAKSKNATTHDAQRCFKKSLDPKKVKGMIVACLRGTNARVQKGETVNKAGGLGMILANDVKTGNEVIADAHVLPATHVSYSEGLSLFSYINSTKSPMAYISAPTTMLDTKLAPFMAAFSSQGPNVINPEFLKPDITAPGVSIIAAFTGAEGPTNLEFDTRRVKFNSISGTSMSCPHIAGVVGLLKSMHPDWSPSAIKSAIMTTARSRDNTESPMKNSSFVEANAFNYGSGHIRPNWAMDPGLVYDVTLEDYMNFLCTLRYNSSTISKFSKSKSYRCPKKRQKLVDFNNPSITIPKLSDHITITRRLKNVGTPGTYTVRVDPPVGVSVTVNPISLEFVDVGEEKEFSVKFEWKNVSNGEDYVFGRLIWSDGVHYVRSPLVIKQVK